MIRCACSPSILQLVRLCAITTRLYPGRRWLMMHHFPDAISRGVFFSGKCFGLPVVSRYPHQDALVFPYLRTTPRVRARAPAFVLPKRC